MKLDIQKGKSYSQKEIAEKMGLKPNTFSKNKEKYQEHLLNFCEFEVDYSRRPHQYKIIDVYDVEYFKRNGRSFNKKIKIIGDKLVLLNKQQPISTPARGCRKIKDDPEIKALGLSDPSLEVYCRIATVERYGTRDGRIKKGTDGWIDDEVLVYLDKDIDEYIVLTDEQINEYFNYIASGHANMVTQATKAFDRYIGKRHHTKEEQQKFDATLSGLEVGVFIAAKKRFKEKHGGTPFWACYYKHFDIDKEKWYNIIKED